MVGRPLRGENWRRPGWHRLWRRRRGLRCGVEPLKLMNCWFRAVCGRRRQLRLRRNDFAMPRMLLRPSRGDFRACPDVQLMSLHLVLKVDRWEREQQEEPRTRLYLNSCSPTSQIHCTCPFGGHHEPALNCERAAGRAADVAGVPGSASGGARNCLHTTAEECTKTAPRMGVLVCTRMVQLRLPLAARDPERCRDWASSGLQRRDAAGGVAPDSASHGARERYPRHLCETMGALGAGRAEHGNGGHGHPAAACPGGPSRAGRRSPSS